jgi:transglutaminase-like putative cysteine protease
MNKLTFFGSTGNERFNIEELGTPQNTANKMREIVQKFKNDMVIYSNLSFSEMFELIKKIPYNQDPDGIEFLKRPYYTMNRHGPGGDCDDKAIALASYCELNKIPWKIVATGRKNPNYPNIPLTHVFLVVYLGNQWVIADPTYSCNVIGKTGSHDRLEFL